MSKGGGEGVVGTWKVWEFELRYKLFYYIVR